MCFKDEGVSAGKKTLSKPYKALSTPGDPLGTQMIYRQIHCPYEGQIYWVCGAYSANAAARASALWR